MISTDVLVIGAGMAGLTLALKLKGEGRQVVCVDKARGSGGRLSSKRIQSDKYSVSFDLGALSFTAQTSQFRQEVKDWSQAGHMTTWLHSEGEEQYIGTPRSSSITRFLADEAAVQFDVRISALVKGEKNWSVYRETQSGETLYAYANEIVLACPAPQTYALLPKEHEFKSLLNGVSIHSQWVAMFALPHTLSVPNLWQHPNTNIARISYENSKPGRHTEHGLHIYLVQASNQWSEARLDYSKDKAVYELANELSQLCPEPIVIKSDYAHRWLYSHGSENGHVENGFLTAEDGLHICGDYLLSELNVDGVEAAYLSGRALATHMNKRHKFSMMESSL
jgi:renalase